MEAKAQEMVQHVRDCLKKASRSPALSDEAWSSVRTMMDTWDAASAMAPPEMLPTIRQCQATVEDSVFLAVTEYYDEAAAAVWPKMIEALRLSEGGGEVTATASSSSRSTSRSGR